jgi:metal-dependent amidase/aminoacylase/carboxypeptidase family protein
MPITDTELIAAVAAQRVAIADTVTFVHSHPELAHEEHLCAAHLAGRLGDAGLRVEQGVARLGTAFRAALAGGRAGRPEGWAFHTDQGAAQFASTAGVDVATDMATVLALATARLSEPTP